MCDAAVWSFCVFPVLQFLILLSDKMKQFVPTVPYGTLAWGRAHEKQNSVSKVAQSNMKWFSCFNLKTVGGTDSGSLSDSLQNNVYGNTVVVVFWLILISWMKTISMVHSIATAVAGVGSARGTRVKSCKEKGWSHNSNFISYIHKKVSVLSKYNRLF